MKKRIFSFCLAFLMIVGLCAGALAAEDTAAAEETEPEVTEAPQPPTQQDRAWGLALDLMETPCGSINVDVGLDGTVRSGDAREHFMKDLSSKDATYEDGSQVAEVRYYSGGDPTYYTLVNLPDQGVYCIKQTHHYETKDQAAGDEYEANRYDEAPAGVFGDMKMIATYLAALGEDMMGAQEQEGEGKYDSDKLVYTLSGDLLGNFVNVCCPELVKGCEGLDWNTISADVTAEVFYGSGRIVMESPSLAEAILGGLEGVETVEDPALTIDINIYAADESNSAYRDNYYTLETLNEKAAELGVEFAETGGTCPELPSQSELLWKEIEEEFSAVAARQENKDDLLAALSDMGFGG